MEKEVRKSINAAIYEYMREQHLTKKALCVILGLSTASLRNKMNGTRDWSWSEVLKLCELMGVTPDQLAGLA